MPGMGHRAMRNADEYDAYTRWRHVMAYLARAGAVKRVKKATHRRERREAKRDLRNN